MGTTKLQRDLDNFLVGFQMNIYSTVMVLVPLSFCPARLEAFEYRDHTSFLTSRLRQGSVPATCVCAGLLLTLGTAGTGPRLLASPLIF